MREALATRQSINIKTYIAENNLDVRFGTVVFDVLYPEESILGKKFKNLNNSSIVAKVLYKGKSILLVGDMEIEEENALMKTGIDLKADVLKVGHHGSKTASSKSFLKLVRPSIAIIQSGKENTFGHPHKETLDKLKEIGVQKIYRNDLDGMVDITF